MTAPKMEIQWTEVSAQAVMEHFAKDYERPVGSFEWFFDAAKGRVVFRLYCEAAPEVTP